MSKAENLMSEWVEAIIFNINNPETIRNLIEEIYEVGFTDGYDEAEKEYSA